MFDTGRMKIDGSADFLSEPHLGLNADVVLEEVKLENLLPLTGRVNLQLRRGKSVISATGHAEYSPYTKVVELKDLLTKYIQLDYVHAAETKESEKQVAAKTAEAAEKVSNHPEWLLRIERGKILNSEFAVLNTVARPQYRVFLADMNIGLANFSNQLSEGTAHIKVTGKFMGSGPTQVSGTFRPENDVAGFRSPHPDGPNEDAVLQRRAARLWEYRCGQRGLFIVYRTESQRWHDQGLCQALVQKRRGLQSGSRPG